jgi:hypothetical protein
MCPISHHVQTNKQTKKVWLRQGSKVETTKDTRGKPTGVAGGQLIVVLEAFQCEALTHP